MRGDSMKPATTGARKMKRKKESEDVADDGLSSASAIDMIIGHVAAAELISRKFDTAIAAFPTIQEEIDGADAAALNAGYDRICVAAAKETAAWITENPFLFKMPYWWRASPAEWRDVERDYLVKYNIGDAYSPTQAAVDVMSALLVNAFFAATEREVEERTKELAEQQQ